MRPIYLLIILIVFSTCSNNKLPSSVVESGEVPKIFPEYTDVTIPPNIAPLNFSIKEAGQEFAVRIASKSGAEIIIRSKKPSILINQNKWKKLLSENKGGEITVDVYCMIDKKWTKYKTITQHIANENIDSYLTYRLINSAYVLWFEMGLYQRNLENFEESTIIQNKSIGGGCVNCHSTSKNNPDKFSFHIRAKFPGTVIYNNGKLEKVNTKTSVSLAAAAYGSWNPDGRHIAFSVNLINQNFFIFKDKGNEVTDKYSDLIIYDTETKQVTTSPKVSTKSRENLPDWSADGKTLYYISTQEAADDYSRYVTRYSLMKIPYDADKNIWGDVDSVISSSKARMSISFPKASPDGKYIVFCGTDFGYFTIHHRISDLYILDLKTGEYRELNEINSRETESYHAWSTNSRWLIFSSRRMDGIHTRTFIAYLDENGKFGKPFVLPQEDPDFYSNYLLNFNRPELMTGKIKISPEDIRDVARGDALPTLFDPKYALDASSGATMFKK
jgi:hypothetical protein